MSQHRRVQDRHQPPDINSLSRPTLYKAVLEQYQKVEVTDDAGLPVVQMVVHE